MLTSLFRGASWLDAWLHQHVGRLYSGILTWGLVITISGGVASLAKSFTLDGGRIDLVKIVLTVALQAALLVNQLAQWSELRQRRQARKAAKSSPPA
jgi:hypothetical protein